MKKLTATLFGALMFAGLFGVQAVQADPDGAGNSDKGLCTAYFNGQKKGHDKQDEQPGPFASLESRAEAATEGEGPAAVWDYCNSLVPVGSGPVIGGQPEHGRYECGPDSNGDTVCTERDDPNTGKGNGSNS